MANAPDLLRYNQYSIDRNHRLGSGTFGIVYMGENTSTREPMCAKHVFNCSIEFSQTEINNMKRASKHPNIVELYDNFIHGGASWIVMEYCPGATLDDHMKTNPDIPERVDIVYQTTQAVKHMHTLDPPMAHRDMKPQNIIISQGPLVKVCDFGLAKSLEISGSANATTFGGTPNYLPPELYLSTVRYDALKSDMFSLGLVFLGTMTCSENQNMESFFTPETGDSIGKQMHELKLTKQPVSVLRKKILQFSHHNLHVMRLVTFLTNMVTFNPDDRVDIMETMDVVADVRDKFAEELLSRQADVTGAEGGALAIAGAAARAPAPAPARGPARAPAPAPARAEARGPRRAEARAPTRAPAGAEARGPRRAEARAPTRAPARVTQSRNINWETARVTAAGDTQMPEGTSAFVAFDQNGAAVLTYNSHIFLYSHNSTSSTSSPSHSLTGKIPLPRGVGFSCYKAITDTTLAVQKDNDDPTFLFRRSDLHQMSTLHHPGELLGALGDHLVYAKKRSTDDYIISVHRAGDEMILEPPAGRTWSNGLSVCDTSRYITVVESSWNSLDVFSATGEHISYRKLKYEPRGYSGITSCGHSHVIVAQFSPPALHIHKLPGGEVIRSISGEELGLGERERMCAMQYSEQGIIHLLTYSISSGTKTFSLRTYKVTE